MGEKIRRFRAAQKKAEREDRKEFECPFCGGDAWWGRENDVARMACRQCGFATMLFYDTNEEEEERSENCDQGRGTE